MEFKRKAELEVEALYAKAPAGLTFTIVRPGGLTDGPPIGPKGEAERRGCRGRPRGHTSHSRRPRQTGVRSMSGRRAVWHRLAAALLSVACRLGRVLSLWRELRGRWGMASPATCSGRWDALMGQIRRRGVKVLHLRWTERGMGVMGFLGPRRVPL